MSQLIDIFLEPAKAWSELKERPSFMLPAAVVMFATTLSAVLYFLNVDPEWFARLSERVARFLGTGRFLAIQTVLVIVWIALNLFLLMRGLLLLALVPRKSAQSFIAAQ